MPSICWAQDDDLEFETVRLEEDLEAQAELKSAIKAYKNDDFLKASLLYIDWSHATSRQ